MSMLADKKHKQKWILSRNLNRNNDWSKDSNKFGQKLLERMGWKEGKGLGRNEDGLTQHVKVAYKSDSKGIGFKDSVEWSVQQDNFKELLGELNNSNKDDSNDNKKNVISLEEKSQNSRARVHYKKFTRGKDLSKYSEKDLANIFGKKKLNCDKSKENNTKDEVESKSTISAGVVTIAGGSMVDYFKKKALNFSMNNVKNDDDSEGEHVSFGFGFNGTTTSLNGFTNGLSVEDNNDDNHKIRKKDKKLKNKTNTFVSHVKAEDLQENSTIKNEETPRKRKSDVLEDISSSSKKTKVDEVAKKNKKKKSKNNDSETDLGIANPGFEPLGNSITIEKHVLDTIAENETECDPHHQSPENEVNCNRKKKKTREEQENHGETTSKSDTLPKKKKKKSKGLDNPCLSLDDTYLSNNQDTVNDSQNTIKNLECNSFQNCEVKRKKSKNIETHLDLADINNSNVENISEETLEVKRKKKKKSKGIDNPALNLNKSDFQEPSACNSISEGLEVKTKKRNKSKGIDNLTMNVNDSYISNSSVSTSRCDEIMNSNSNDYSTFEVKRKKKKKPKGIDNPGLNLNESNCSKNEDEISEKCLQNGIENSALEVIDCDIMLNVTNEPVKSKVTPKVEKYTPKRKGKNVRFSKTNQEFVFSERSPDDITKRNELYGINTKVIENSLRDLKKQHGHMEDHNFDITSVDKLDFCDDGTSTVKKYVGIDNQGFDIRNQKVEESVNMITQTIESYQAEVENGINESKVRKVYAEHMIGELHCSDGENEQHPEGIKLLYKYAMFSKNEPIWSKKNDAQATVPKKSYKHLIRGDIIVGFRDTNLHEIKGYGLRNNDQGS